MFLKFMYRLVFMKQVSGTSFRDKYISILFFLFCGNQHAESFSLNIKRTSDVDLIVLLMHSYLHVQNAVCCLNLWIIEWASTLSYVFGPLNSVVTLNRDGRLKCRHGGFSKGNLSLNWISPPRSIFSELSQLPAERWLYLAAVFTGSSGVQQCWP